MVRSTYPYAMTDRDRVSGVYDAPQGRPQRTIAFDDVDRPLVVADLNRVLAEIDEMRAMLTEMLVMARQAAPLLRLADNPAARFIRSVGGSRG